MEKIVYVKWSDSNIYHDQYSKDKSFEFAIVESIGFLVDDKKDCIVIAGDSIDTDIRRVIAIPKVNIIKQKITKLK